jgi:hypothetical protein
MEDRHPATHAMIASGTAVHLILKMPEGGKRA